MARGRNLWVPGHVLVNSGAPPGPGPAVCTCGATSGELSSQAKRIKWMREVHKPEVLEKRKGR